MSTFMNPLPPQAYTKETLVHAYAWLQNQSGNIKEMATTPDVLVSLYLKAKLQGDGALERPSIQNFKNELKNLAGMMGEFEDGQAPTPAHTPANTGASASRAGNQTIRIRSQDLRPQTPTPPPAPVQAQHVQAQVVEPIPPPQAPMTTPATPTPQGSSYTQSSMQLKFEERSMTTAAPTLAEMLDSRSMDMIQEVKIQFNLSSDSEALRLLLANGYNQIKSLLK